MLGFLRWPTQRAVRPGLSTENLANRNNQILGRGAACDVRVAAIAGRWPSIAARSAPGVIMGTVWPDSETAASLFRRASS